jgi:hypothetical protein
MDDIKTSTPQDATQNYSSSYVPKPGDVIHPQHFSEPEVFVQVPPAVPLTSPVVPVKPAVPLVEEKAEVLTSIRVSQDSPIPVVPVSNTSPVSSQSPVAEIVPGKPVPFPNPFADPSDLDPEKLKAKASDLQKMGVEVVTSSKFKKILFYIIGGIIAVVIIMFGVNIAMTYLFPKPPEVIAPPIIAPPVVKVDPKEDKSSLKYIDGKVRELKPSLTELNNDSSFMLKLHLEDSDYEKNVQL